MSDFDKFRRQLSIYAAALGRSAEEAVRQAAKIYAQNAQKETVLQTGRGRSGRAGSVGQARREQLEALKRRILAERSSRRKSLSAPRRHLSKVETSPYFRAVRARIGELASAWNAALLATNGKFVAGTRKHGTAHGSFNFKKTAAGAEAVVFARTSGAPLNHVAKAAQRTASLYFAKQAAFALKKLKKGFKF